MHPGELGLAVQNQHSLGDRGTHQPAQEQAAFPEFSEAIGYSNPLGNQFPLQAAPCSNTADLLQVKFMNSAATEESKSSLFYHQHATT